MASNYWIIFSNELEKMYKKAVVAKFKVIFAEFACRNCENHENPVRIFRPTFKPVMFLMLPVQTRLMALKALFFLLLSSSSS
jgi:hypothetical protein